jgi:site-specific DNA-methyltransferase (adenine-specific)
MHADCRDFLPTIESGSADLVLTDPPFAISRETGFQKGNDPAYDRLKVSMEFGEWDKPVDGMDQVIREFYRVLKTGGTLICFWDLWKLSSLDEMMKAAGFKQLRFIELVKTNPVPLNQSSNYLTNAREIALTGVKGGKPTFHSKYDNGIYSFPIEHSADRWHPTQKSLKLFCALIEKHSNPGDLVLDPFAGSCTTGAAALQTDRRFVGCEIDRGYWEKAVQRLQGVSGRE